MKQAILSQKATRSKKGGGRKSISLLPPSYGIEYLDRGGNELASSQPEKCNCGEKKRNQAYKTCTCGGPKTRPPVGKGDASEEKAGARYLLQNPQKEKPPSNGGNATIRCDGNGGYRVDLGGWAGTPCGIEGCVKKHEESHIADWIKRWPKGCEGKDDGGDIPLGEDGYDDFLKASECSAYTIEESCIQALLPSATGECKETLRDHLIDTQHQKATYCS